MVHLPKRFLASSSNSLFNTLPTAGLSNHLCPLGFAKYSLLGVMTFNAKKYQGIHNVSGASTYWVGNKTDHRTSEISKIAIFAIAVLLLSFVEAHLLSSCSCATNSGLLSETIGLILTLKLFLLPRHAKPVMPLLRH